MDDAKIRLALIEDNEDDYFLTLKMLQEMQGWQIHLDWASNFSDGLNMVPTGDHDLYLIDYALGRDDGIQILAEAVHVGIDAPIIMLTGNDRRDIEYRSHAGRSGGLSD